MSEGLAPSWRGWAAACGVDKQQSNKPDARPDWRKEAGQLNAAFTLPARLSVPITAPFLLLASSPGKGWGMMKAPRHSPILRDPKRALLPLKLLSKALEMKSNMVLICSFFYNIIKTAVNLNQRHKIAGGKLCCAGRAEPGRSWHCLRAPGVPAGRGVTLAEGLWLLSAGWHPP